jgi:hypothetical protein
VGRPLFGEIEPEMNPLKVDHVWLMMDIGEVLPLKLAINTLSIRNREAGFDPRVRVGLHRETYQELPEVGVYPHPGLDYGQYELTHNVFYEHYDQRTMENLLIDKIGSAILVEVWGELYASRSVGIHQIHCRRASCGVPIDLLGEDGALKFYFGTENSSEMLLFKFCGQP